MFTRGYAGDPKKCPASGIGYGTFNYPEERLIENKRAPGRN